MSDLVDILYDISNGVKNDAGDHWSLDHCAEAAQYIETLQAALAESKEEAAQLRGRLRDAEEIMREGSYTMRGLRLRKKYRKETR